MRSREEIDSALESFVQGTMLRVRMAFYDRVRKIDRTAHYLVEKHHDGGWIIGGRDHGEHLLNVAEVVDFEILVADHPLDPTPLTIQPPTTTASLWFVDDGYAERLDTISSAHGLQMRSLVMAKALLDNASADIHVLIENDEGPV